VNIDEGQSGDLHSAYQAAAMDHETCREARLLRRTLATVAWDVCTSSQRTHTHTHLTHLTYSTIYIRLYKMWTLYFDTIYTTALFRFRVFTIIF